MPPLQGQVQTVLTWLENSGTQEAREGMARYAIPSDNAFGIPLGSLRQYAKSLGRNHELAGALWDTGWYEARMLASFIDDPVCVTPEQMDRWCRDFDSWAICDTVCFQLFDRTSYAWDKVRQWSGDPDEFVKRGAFALLACLALHDQRSPDAPFAEGLLLVEQAAADERNFVKKSVNWALRAVGERSPSLNVAAVAVAQRLASSPEATPRWVGKDALRQLASPAATRRLASRQIPRLLPEAPFDSAE